MLLPNSTRRGMSVVELDSLTDLPILERYMRSSDPWSESRSHMRW